MNFDAKGSGNAPDASIVYKWLLASVNKFCEAFDGGLVTPFLEANVTAFLYHSILLEGCPPSFLYCEARVQGLPRQDRKYDLVLGKGNLSNGTVSPILIAQIKCFQRWGQTNQQFRERFMHVLEDDIPSLQLAEPVLEFGRVQLIADLTDRFRGRGYLGGRFKMKSRKDLLVTRCAASKIQLLWIHPKGTNGLTLEVLT